MHQSEGQSPRMCRCGMTGCIPPQARPFATWSLWAWKESTSVQREGHANKVSAIFAQSDSANLAAMLNSRRWR
jgi:hypothetical protein